MGILVEIQGSKNVVWTDTDDVQWMGTGAVEWVDADNSDTLYLSLNGEALDHFWDPFVKTFSNPAFETASPYGGEVKLTFGSIVMSPDAFSGDWPPPKNLTVVIKYTATTEDAAVELFSGDIYRGDYDELSATYQIYAPKFTKKLLYEGPDYNGDTVAYPRAIGSIVRREALRVADNAGRPTYHLAGVSTTSTAIAVVSYASASAGTKTQITLESAHGWSNGTSVTLNGTTNFNGAHTIESVSGATFVIPVAYPSNNSEALPPHANAFISGGFAVEDDGVPIQGNVVVNGDGTFSLLASPVGTVTISGTASETTLLEFVTWAQGQLNGVGSLDSASSRGTSPDVSYWATNQMPLTDFLSEICKYFTHWFKIANGTLYFGDMLLDNGSETYTEGDYFKASYGTQNAVSQIKATWYTYQAVETFVDEVRTARFVKEVKNTVVKSLHQVSTGTTDGTQAGYLADSGATFASDGIKVNDVAQNTTDDTSAVVLAVSETSLQLDNDIFVSGEDYVVGPSFPNAEPMEIEPFHTDKSEVSTALLNILGVLSKDVAEITIPIEGALPEPGNKLTFTDTQTIVDMTTWIRARNIRYDFSTLIPKATIRGEGVSI